MNEDEEREFREAYEAVKHDPKAREHIEYLWQAYNDIALVAEIQRWNTEPGSMNLFKMLDDCKVIMDEVKAMQAQGNSSAHAKENN